MCLFLKCGFHIKHQNTYWNHPKKPNLQLAWTEIPFALLIVLVRKCTETVYLIANSNRTNERNELKKYVVNWFEHLYRDMDFYKHWGLRNLSWNKSATFGDYVSRYGFCKVLELGNPPLYRYKPSIVDHN